jgi:hypothetical protein
MTSVLISLLATLRGIVRSRAGLHVEILALRHQLQVLQRSQPPRLRVGHSDRWLWAWLSHTWRSWRTALVIVKPETVIAWHREGISAVLDVEQSSTDGSAAHLLRCADADPVNTARRSVAGHLRPFVSPVVSAALFASKRGGERLQQLASAVPYARTGADTLVNVDAPAMGCWFKSSQMTNFTRSLLV